MPRALFPESFGVLLFLKSMGVNMILSQSSSEHIGKTIKEIKGDSYGDDLTMCDEIIIYFSDGSNVILKTDWGGRDCYISQYVSERRK